MRFVDRLLQRWRATVARPWVPRGGRVLDIGCHRGEFFAFLGRRLGSGVGLDPLAPPLAGPRWVILPQRFPPDPPLGAGSFDAVVMLATLEHVRDTDELARECFRVLRPGGRVIITVPSRLVDPIVDVLHRLKLADGMSLDEHHGYDPAATPRIFGRHGFRLEHARPFQLGLNHLFVLTKPV